MTQKTLSATISQNSTLKDAMNCLNKSGSGIVLVINHKEQLVGVLTDGDIRKVLLRRKTLTSKTIPFINRQPITASPSTSSQKLLRIMLKKGIHQIPIVDKNNTLIDLILLRELQTIPLSKPDISKEEIKLIHEVLSTPYLSIGPQIKKFEQLTADYLGVKYAVAVNSGTSALHLCIRSLGIKDRDEVITTPFSFIASANCILFERATPVFVDIDPKTLCIDPDKIEEKITKKTKAILPVHIFGHPCDMDAIMKSAKKYNVAVIEDACEAIGAEYKGKKVGTFGDVSVLAFYPNKQITTAEGGMVLTNNKKIAILCRMMSNQGRAPHHKWLHHSILGYNYRMSELHAALGVSQIKKIDTFLKKREKIVWLYNKKLKDVPGINIPYVASNVKMSWFVYVITLDEKYFTPKDRNFIMEKLQKCGIASNNYFPPIHLEPLYKKLFQYPKGTYPNTEKISGLTIALPFHNNLQEEEVNYIVSALKKILQNHSLTMYR